MKAEMVVEEGTHNGEGAESGKEVKFFKSEPATNKFGSVFVTDSVDGSSGGSESFRTYKRQRQLRSSSKIKVQDGVGASTDQVTHPLTDHCASLNDSNYHLQRKWRNVVLEHMHQSLSGDEGGIQPCIQDALLFHQKNGCNVTVKDSGTSHDDKQNCSPRAGKTPNGTRHTAEGLEGVTSNGSCKELNPQTTTEICKRVFFDVIISEKFTSLCKLLLDNFQGIKLDNLFHLNLINSRMKEGVYEHSPMLFSSDIQQVWRKLQEVGTEIISLAKSLSNISSTSYNEQVGCSGGAVAEEKHEVCTQEPETLPKPEQNEACGDYEVSTCRYCEEKADGNDCLVCDSCEESFHFACIEPALKVIPPKAWYCASCTSNGMGSPHENCVTCDKLNAPRTVDNNVGDEIFETFTELEDNSNCRVNNGVQLSPGSDAPRDCKICGSDIEKGEKLRSCGHPYCPNKYYHVRCLTMKQLKTYCSCWYCPSCLCRTCLIDKDDDKILLCDGCEAAYHIYCMKPPQTTIPEGKWFCRKCDAGIQLIRRGKRAYENNLKTEGIGTACDNRDFSPNQKEREESDKSRGRMDNSE